MVGRSLSRLLVLREIDLLSGAGNLSRSTLVSLGRSSSSLWGLYPDLVDRFKGGISSTSDLDMEYY